MKMNKTLGLFAAVVALSACEKHDVESVKPLDDSPLFVNLGKSGGATARSGNHYALYTGEFIASEESGQVGRIVYFNNVGNKQLGADFVPGLSLDGTDDISYYIDENRPSADLPLAVSSAAITRAMDTWDGVSCSDLGLNRVPSNAGTATGFIAALLDLDGSFDYVADVVHSGWLSGAFFNAIAPGGSAYILGVTFTIIFTDELGNPLDSNNDGKIDVAWREIYYNDAFTWKDGATYDVETIALHEAGHGLSQGHFGKAFVDGSGKHLHFSPRAVMNAAYSGIQRQIGKTDNGGHCSNWASWPTN